MSEARRALITGMTGMVGSYLADYLYAHTGWQPEIPYEQMMRDLLEYWAIGCQRRGAG